MNVVVLNAHAETAQKLSDVRTQTVQEKKAHETVSKRLSEVSEQKVGIESSLKEERVRAQNLEAENESLKVNLQAKKDAQAKAATVQTRKVQAKAPAVQVSGSCADWLAGAGVPDIASAMTLIGRESGCNPNAVNPQSGACGVAQELPCGKSGCSLGDGACQVRWMNSYVHDRYGSWGNALGHSYSVGWY